MLTVEQSLFFDRGERLVFYSYWLQFLFYIADISHKNGVFFRFHTVSMLRFPSEISFLGTAVFNVRFEVLASCDYKKLVCSGM